MFAVPINLRPLPIGAPTGPNWPNIREFNNALENGRAWPELTYWEARQEEIWGPQLGTILFNRLQIPQLRNVEFKESNFFINWNFSFNLNEIMLERLIFSLVNFFNNEISRFFYQPNDRQYQRPMFQLALYRYNPEAEVSMHVFGSNLLHKNDFLKEIESLLEDIDSKITRGNFQQTILDLGLQVGSKNTSFFYELFDTDPFGARYQYRWDLRIKFPFPSTPRFFNPHDLIETEEILTDQVSLFENYWEEWEAYVRRN